MSFKKIVRVLSAYLRRDLLLEKSYFLSWIGKIVGMCFTLALLYYVSALVDPEKLPVKSGYFVFVLLGVLCARLQSACLGVCTTALRRERSFGTLALVLNSPFGFFYLILGSLFWPIFFNLFSGILFAILFLHNSFAMMTVSSLFFIALILFLGLINFIAIGLLSLSFTLIFFRGDPIRWFFSRGSELFSGVYFPLLLLPAAASFIPPFLPLTHVLHALRKLLLSPQGITAITSDLTALAALGAVYFCFGVFFVRKALKEGKCRGTLLFY